MRKIAARFVALGMVLLWAAPVQATHVAKQRHQRHVRMTHVRKPPAYMLADTVPVPPAKFCTYMGGPKSTLWRCY